MSNYVPVSSEIHRHHFWRPPADRRHASEQAIIHLGLTEVPVAGLSLPIAFVTMPDGSYSIVVVLGIEVTENLFVAPDGRWIGRYEPTALKSYPFAMVPTKEAQLTLCFDSKTDLIAAIPHGQPIFDAPGQPTEAIRTIMDGMVRAHQDLAAARAASAQLHKLGLIKPWPITLKTSRGEKRIEGLFQVDEAALNALDDDQFLSLRRSGALLMAYCQLLSTHNLNILAQLANNRPAVPAPLSAPAMELDFSRLGG